MWQQKQLWEMWQKCSEKWGCRLVANWVSSYSDTKLRKRNKEERKLSHDNQNKKRMKKTKLYLTIFRSLSEYAHRKINNIFGLSLKLFYQKMKTMELFGINFNTSNLFITLVWTKYLISLCITFRQIIVHMWLTVQEINIICIFFY